MERHEFVLPAGEQLAARGHAGVVASGDLEVLFVPTDSGKTRFIIRTSVDGHGTLWRSVLERFQAAHPVVADIHINDNGATPGMVALRLSQALERCIS